MCCIERVHAREVFDSRGKPTVEVEVTCHGARTGRAIVPSGASTGRFESVELRDRDSERLDGTGVTRAVANVCGEIAGAIQGMDATDQADIDRTLCNLDGTPNKSRLGANAILGVSLATVYASAEALRVTPVERMRDIWRQLPQQRTVPDQNPRRACEEDVEHVSNVLVFSTNLGTLETCPTKNSQTRSGPARRTALLGNDYLLPLPMVNMISGGLHAGRNLDFQDFLIIPVGAKSFRQAMDWIVSVYRRLGERLTQAGHEGVLVGDEGGYGPQLHSNQAALEFIVAAIEASGLTPGPDVSIGIDVASSHFYRDGGYRLKSTRETNCENLSARQLTELYSDWIDRFPLISIEDGLAEDDWEGWRQLTHRLGHRSQLIGDDLFVTNPDRLQQGVTLAAANSVLIKVNQIGTLWETLQTLRMAIDADYWPVISARSGETEDTTIADLAVATGAGQIKIGSVARSERLAKYNQLLRLEEQLDGQAEYIGGAIFSGLESGTN